MYSETTVITNQEFHYASRVFRPCKLVATDYGGHRRHNLQAKYCTPTVPCVLIKSVFIPANHSVKYYKHMSKDSKRTLCGISFISLEVNEILVGMAYIQKRYSQASPNLNRMKIPCDSSVPSVHSIPPREVQYERVTTQKRL